MDGEEEAIYRCAIHKKMLIVIQVVICGWFSKLISHHQPYIIALSFTGIKRTILSTSTQTQQNNSMDVIPLVYIVPRVFLLFFFVIFLVLSNHGLQLLIQIQPNPKHDPSCNTGLATWTTSGTMHIDYAVIMHVAGPWLQFICPADLSIELTRHQSPLTMICPISSSQYKVIFRKQAL